MFLNPSKIVELCNILRSYKIKLLKMQQNVLEAGIKKHLGTFGDFGVISFNGNKIITSGGGGIVLLKISLIIKRLNLIRNMKIKHPFEQKFADVGYNYRLPSINSSLGISQLSKINIF